MARRKRRARVSALRARGAKAQQVLIEKERTLFVQEQTLLSKERTVLSFMQTGLAFIGAGVVVSSVLSALEFRVLGWVLILVGFAEVVESWRRLRRYQGKMRRVRSALGDEYV